MAPHSALLPSFRDGRAQGLATSSGDVEVFAPQRSNAAAVAAGLWCFATNFVIL